jgi:hypothetical protein
MKLIFKNNTIALLYKESRIDQTQIAVGLLWGRRYVCLGLWDQAGFRGLQIKWCTAELED